MRSTRKKTIKTVYKDDSEDEAAGDFSDSGSEAKISENSSTDDDDEEAITSGEEFTEQPKEKPKIKRRTLPKPCPPQKSRFAKSFISKINKQNIRPEIEDVAPMLFSVNDLTEADKLLPSVLNLSESDSSDDETEKSIVSPKASTSTAVQNEEDEHISEKLEYEDVWSQKKHDNSSEIAEKTFMDFQNHQDNLEKTKASILSYTIKAENEKESNVNDLLAMGEEVMPDQGLVKTKKKRAKQKDSDSEMEDWEEVQEKEAIPQQGLQLIVDIPGAICRKSKKLDVEMMMKRKINRVKKEYQVFMHKVHVLSWLGHGNYVSKVLNDQEVLAAALSLLPSKECYPGDRVDMKYVEQITTWYKDKIILKHDKNEDKFKPKAPPLKTKLIEQAKKKVTTSKKYMVFIFVSTLRALGLQCRVMFNFVTLPIKPPSSELCSLSVKNKNDSENEKQNKSNTELNKKQILKTKPKKKLLQVDGADEFTSSDESGCENIWQLDGSTDALPVRAKSTRSCRVNKNKTDSTSNINEDVSPPKLAKMSPKPLDTNKTEQLLENNKEVEKKPASKRKPVNKEDKSHISEEPKPKRSRSKKADTTSKNVCDEKSDVKVKKENPSPRKTRSLSKNSDSSNKSTDMPLKTISKKSEKKIVTNTKLLSPKKELNENKTTNKPSPSKIQSSINTESNEKKTSNIKKNLIPPKIIITSDDDNKEVSSTYFKKPNKKLSLSLDRSQTTNTKSNTTVKQEAKSKSRTKSAPGIKLETSKYFECDDLESIKNKSTRTRQTMKQSDASDLERVSHRDLTRVNAKPINDVTKDLVDIIKKGIKESNSKGKKVIVKGKVNNHSDSDEDFKPTKVNPRVSSCRKIDRRVLSSDDDSIDNSNKINVWCEVFVEELEQWVAVDVTRGKVHCANEIYQKSTHPVCYVVGWDNNNNLKDLTRRYVPHWNTVTRKQRAEPDWWEVALRPWKGARTARDREEDEQLDRMQLEAPLPKSIAEFKNHPLYALKRHLLKFEAIYPPDAVTLGFVRNEPVYSRDCVYVCKSRDIWLKEAKVVKLKEQPYKVVKSRPKWDKLSNKLITDKPLEIFGPWQTQDYEPPVAANGIVPRNAYGNVELFKICMLPIGTVHIKLPGLSRVAKKLGIDCSPAITGFDFNGGYSHPVYDGFVVCQEFEETLTEAWLKDQEEMERREREKTDARVYGNWKRLIKGLIIRERLKDKYGFENLHTSQDKKKGKGPRLVVKKK